LPEAHPGAAAAADTAKWILDGAAGIDQDLGFSTAVGDLDGDGYDDLAIVGNDYAPSPNLYVVLGADLVALAPGRYPVADVARLVLTVPQTLDCGGAGSCYTEQSAVPWIDGGLLYVGQWRDADFAAIVPWEQLAAVPRGVPAAVADVATVTFHRTGAPVRGGAGQALAVCDLDGDGEKDLLLAGQSRRPDYGLETLPAPGLLALGPFAPGSVDVASAAVPVEWTTASTQYVDSSATDWGPTGVGPCRDFDGDGIDDIVLSSCDPATGDAILGVYRGGPDVGTERLDLARPDAWVAVANDDDFHGLYATAEGAGDANGDGRLDLLGTSYVTTPAGWTSTAWVFELDSAFSGGAIDLGAATATFTDPRSPFLGLGASLAGDADGDGYDEVILGDPGTIRDLGDPDLVGGLVASTSCLDAGSELAGPDVGDVRLSSGHLGFGSVVVGAGDVDGNGLSDLVIGTGYEGGASAGSVYVLAR
jgi:hypothetical protein